MRVPLTVFEQWVRPCVVSPTITSLVEQNWLEGWPTVPPPEKAPPRPVLPDDSVLQPREFFVSRDRELPPAAGISVRRFEPDVSGTDKPPIWALSI